MRQTTIRKRVGEVEHETTTLRASPQDFAAYQFHLDRLHTKAKARDARKAAAAKTEASFAGTRADSTFKASDLQRGKDYLDFDGIMTTGYGLDPEALGAKAYGARNWPRPDVKAAVEEAAKKAGDSVLNRLLRRGASGGGRTLFTDVPTMEEILERSTVRGPAFVVPGGDDLETAEVFMDGKSIGKVTFDGILDPGLHGAVTKLVRDHLAKTAETPARDRSPPSSPRAG